MICIATGPSPCLPFAAAGPAIHDLDFSHSLVRFGDTLERLFPASVQGPRPFIRLHNIGGLETQNSISETRHGIMILGWHHIALTGDCDWYSGAAEGINARPLNLYSVRIRAREPRLSGQPWRCLA